jgi:hypothetical protein
MPQYQLKEENGKFLYRDGEPIAVYKQNGTLRFFKLIELGYADLAEIYEPGTNLYAPKPGVITSPPSSLL